MKITKEIWEQGVLMEVKEFKDIESAMSDTNDDAKEILARFITTILNGTATKSEAVSYILGSGYQVEE